MITAGGKNRWMLKSWHDNRVLYLKDSTGLDADDRTFYELSDTDGKGKTNPDCYLITPNNLTPEALHTVKDIDRRTIHGLA